ncbi:MAG: MGMT family protein, partial [Methanobacteriaceae archaeon]
MIRGNSITDKVIISTYNYRKLYFAVAVKDCKIIKTILPKSSEKEALNEISMGLGFYILSDEYRSFAEDTCNIYRGKYTSSENKAMDLDLSEFQRKVLLEVMKIPCGKIRTYKQISEAIDSKAYRAVGTAIGKNPLPLIIPCHRVVRSDFSVGGFSGGFEMKKEILKNEGIHIVNDKIK